MSYQLELQSEDDEGFLDAAYERVLEALESGTHLTVDELLAGKEHLRRELELVFETARGLARPSHPLVPRVRGFAIEREIGRGGMGIVFLARQEALGGREVALKVLPPSTQAWSRARERFLHEARLLARLKHPHVVTVHDVVDDGSVCAYAMELIDGGSLRRVIRALEGDAGPPSIARVDTELGGSMERTSGSYASFVARVGVAIARALGALHRAGSIHRDVKPSNILLRRDGTPLLSDFGLVHAADRGVTHTGHFVGSVDYAPPEQLAGEPERVDVRSDVYSLGVTLYHALSLHLPFDDRGARAACSSANSTAMLRRIESRPAVPLRAWNSELPRDLETVVAKAIEIEPARRYATADELADDLQRVLDLRPIHARPAGVVERTLKKLRRNRSAARGAMVGSVATLGLATAAAVYCVVVPRYVEARITDARLELLKPSTSPVTLLGSFAGTNPGAAWNKILRERTTVLQVSGDAMRRALDAYSAARWWPPLASTIAAERETVRAVLEGRATKTSSDHRLEGLRAYLVGDIDVALAHWASYEALHVAGGDRDPFVQAASGVLLLGQGKCELAYDCLYGARRTFPDVAFLAVFQADAAVRLGKLDAAESLLAAAASMPDTDGISTLERVRADTLRARGKLVEAERGYRELSGARARIEFARLLMSTGRAREAVERLVPALSDRTDERQVQRELVGAMDCWWSALTAPERRAEVRSLVDGDRSDDKAFGRLMQIYGQARAATRMATSSVERNDVPNRPAPDALLRDFATLRAAFDAPSLETLDLSTLSRVLEIDEMLHTIHPESRATNLARLHFAARVAQSPQLCELVFRARQRAPLPIAVATLALTCGAQVTSFRGIGYLPGGASYSTLRGVSPDGSTAVGESASAAGIEAVTVRDGVMHPLADLAGGAVVSRAYGANFDGSIVVGSGENASNRKPVRWNWSSLVPLPQPPAFSGEGYSLGGISADGRVIYATAKNAQLYSVGVRIVDGVLSTLPKAAGATQAGVNGTCSADGRVIGGHSDFTNGAYRAGVWVDGVWNQLPKLSGGPDYAEVVSVSANGLVQVGVSSSSTVPTAPHGEPVRWVGGQVGSLGHVLGGMRDGVAWSCTYDGSVVVGWTMVSPNDRRAFVWDEVNGMRLLSDYLTSSLGLDLTGWTLIDAYAMTPDGSVIVGEGRNPNGQTEGWIARIAPSSAWAYCTAGTTTNGCAATMSAIGVPSATASSGFRLQATGVEGQKNGLYFYGFAPTLVPWKPFVSTSWLCVASPHVRTTTFNSGGPANGCDGSFALDWSAWVAANPHAAGAPYGVGESFYAQAWFRDPPAPRGTNLSNAIGWTLQP